MAIKHTFLSKDGQKTKVLTAMKAVREKCLECCCWDSSEVRRCPASDCALHCFRMGRSSREEAHISVSSEDQTLDIPRAG